MVLCTISLPDNAAGIAGSIQRLAGIEVNVGLRGVALGIFPVDDPVEQAETTNITSKAINERRVNAVFKGGSRMRFPEL
jgi:hypothetical protein